MVQRKNRLARVTAILAIAALTALTGTAALAAQNWPEKPVRIIVSFPPGGGSDLVARLFAKHFSDEFGEQFVVENKPGAAGTIATTALKDAKPDGYTFMLSNLTPFNVAPVRFPDTPYDPIEDFTHVSYIGAIYLGIFVSADLGIADLPGLIAKAKADPGSLDYGTSGVGSWGHVVSEQFKHIAGVDMVHIPYKGSGPMRRDYRGGVVPIIFDALPQNLPMIAEGKSVALAISAPARIPTSPDIPTFTEKQIAIVAENWLGFSAPAGLDPAIAGKMDAAVAKVAAMPEVQAQFATWGLTRTAMSGDKFAQFVQDQSTTWRPMVKAALAE